MKSFYFISFLTMSFLLSCNKKNNNSTIHYYTGITHVVYKKSEIISASGSWSTTLKDTTYNETIIVKYNSKKVTFEFPVSSLLFKNYRNTHQFTLNKNGTYNFEYYNKDENEVSEHFLVNGNTLTISMRWLDGYTGAKYELTEIDFTGNK